jgi:uncharacterized protein (DUF58 family)
MRAIKTPIELRAAADEAIRNSGAFLPADARKTVNTAHGRHDLRKPGTGEKFWQFRDYQTHDSPRDIDWRQSAKGERIFIRERERQNAQNVYFWCACGASMRFRSEHAALSKAESGAVLILALAIMATNGGELAAIMDGAQRPGRSEHTLSRMGEQLLAHINDTDKTLPGQELASLSRGYTAVLAGDFLGPPEEIESAVNDMQAGASGGLLIQILDPAELTLPYDGRLIFQPPGENRPEMRPEMRYEIENAADIRARYVERIKAHTDSVASICRRAGWHYMLHDTANAPAQTLSAAGLLFDDERGGGRGA